MKKGMLRELFLPKGGLEIVSASKSFAKDFVSKRKSANKTPSAFGSISKLRIFVAPKLFAAFTKEPVPPAGSMTVLFEKPPTNSLTRVANRSARSFGV